MNEKGIAADPVNVALVGTKAEITNAFRAAGWVADDSLSRAREFAIARSVLFNRPDFTAPVSPLFLFGRRQDLAYEQEIGPSARRRHHAPPTDAGVPSLVAMKDRFWQWGHHFRRT